MDEKKILTEQREVALQEFSEKQTDLEILNKEIERLVAEGSGKRTQKAQESKNADIPALKQAEESFHTDYLIRNFGGEIQDTASMIASKQVQKEQIEARISALEMDVARYDEAIGAIEAKEAEAAAKAEEIMKAQSEFAAEPVVIRPKAESEEEMRARIEAEVRAQLEAEAKVRAEAEARIRAEAEAQAEAKRQNEISQEIASRGKRPYVADQKLANALNRFFDKLEVYYPEGKVFALDALDDQLRERLAGLYKRAGYLTANDMLHAYGFEVISGKTVKELRGYVIYTPGNEPEFIKPKVESMLHRLEEYYPDHVISRSVQNDHKSLSKDISGLYQWLGYADIAAMLRAYGYEYNAGEPGRPARDYQPIIDALVEKYKDSPKPHSMGEILHDNPELKGPLKTLQNMAVEMFGMSLKKYFTEIGIFSSETSSGTKRTYTTSMGIQDAALESLTKLYAALDENEYGTIEDALACLEGMNVKKNKEGQVYLFRGVSCPSSITIPYGIDFVSSRAFMDKKDLEEVVFLATLTEIPAEAFRDCSALKRINIPEGVTKIGASAFANCSSLESITLPKSLKRVETLAFANCSSLETVEFLNPVVVVDNDAFSGSPYKYELLEDENASEFVIADGVLKKYTGPGGDVVIPEGVISISSDAFKNNTSIRTIALPETLRRILNGAFSGCEALSEIKFSKGLIEIAPRAFYMCSSLSQIQLPKTLQTIGHRAFKLCTSLTTVTFSNQLVEIASNAFDSCPYQPPQADFYREWNRISEEEAIYLGARVYCMPEIRQDICDWVEENNEKMFGDMGGVFSAELCDDGLIIRDSGPEYYYVGHNMHDEIQDFYDSLKALFPKTIIVGYIEIQDEYSSYYEVFYGSFGSKKVSHSWMEKCINCGSVVETSYMDESDWGGDIFPYFRCICCPKCAGRILGDKSWELDNEEYYIAVAERFFSDLPRFSEKEFSTEDANKLLKEFPEFIEEGFCEEEFLEKAETYKTALTEFINRRSGNEPISGKNQENAEICLTDVDHNQAFSENRADAVDVTIILTDLHGVQHKLLLSSEDIEHPINLNCYPEDFLAANHVDTLIRLLLDSIDGEGVETQKEEITIFGEQLKAKLNDNGFSSLELVKIFDIKAPFFFGWLKSNIPYADVKKLAQKVHSSAEKNRQKNIESFETYIESFEPWFPKSEVPGWPEFCMYRVVDKGNGRKYFIRNPECKLVPKLDWSCAASSVEEFAQLICSKGNPREYAIERVFIDYVSGSVEQTATYMPDGPDKKIPEEKTGTAVVDSSSVDEQSCGQQVEPAQACAGLTFVITGKVNIFKNRDEFIDYVEGHGGKVSGSVSKKTNYLVNNDLDSTSAKNQKAQELGIQIISESTFAEMFGSP